MKTIFCKDSNTIGIHQDVAWINQGEDNMKTKNKACYYRALGLIIGLMVNMAVMASPVGSTKPQEPQCSSAGQCPSFCMNKWMKIGSCSNGKCQYKDGGLCGY